MTVMRSYTTKNFASTLSEDQPSGGYSPGYMSSTRLVCWDYTLWSLFSISSCKQSIDYKFPHSPDKSSRIARMENGQCIIGMQSISMIPLIAFDAVVNVYLTVLFLIPLKSEFQQSIINEQRRSKS